MAPLGISGTIAHQTMTLTIAADNGLGLTSAEARARLNQFGPNAVAEEKPHPLKAFLKRFWAPIPWLLEASIIIQLVHRRNRRGGGHRRVARRERRVELPPGGPRAKDARFAPAATSRPGARAARRPVDHAPGRRTRPRRCSPSAPGQHCAGGREDRRRHAARGPVSVDRRIGRGVSRSGQNRLRGRDGARR